MRRQAVTTDRAPQALGPYAQAVRAGGFLFVAGQIGLDPASGELVEGRIKGQTERVMENLKGILQAGGSGMDRVVKTTVYLASMDDFPAMNEVYGRYFEAPYPARATVEVAGLPKGVRVEVEAIALVGE